MAEAENTLAVFIDFENLAMGFKHTGAAISTSTGSSSGWWRRARSSSRWPTPTGADYEQYTQPLHETAIELIEIPRRSMTGKNSADIRLCVDAMDLATSKEHIDTFVIVSGDSDFSPLVSKLKENGKHVIGLGMKESTSDLLRDNCDEFIFYEDLARRRPGRRARRPGLPQEKREVFELLFESITGLMRENKEILWSSMVKDTMKRKRPAFAEPAHGYRTFSDLLEDAQKRGFITLRTDPTSGTYVVVGFAKPGR